MKISFGDDETDVEEQERMHKDEYETSAFGSSTSEYSVREDEMRSIDSFSLANWDDETDTSLREQVKKNKRILAMFSVFSGLFFIVLVMWLMPFLPGIGDLWTWGIVLVPMGIVGIMLMGRRSLIEDLTGYDWLCIVLEDDLYLMVVEPTGTGKNGMRTFEIYKGWSKFGYKPRKLLLADISVKMPRLVYNDADYETPAKIRVKSEHTKTKVDTLLGRVIVTRGRELDIDEKASEAVITVKRPVDIGESSYQEVTSRLDTISTLLEKSEMRAEAIDVESDRAYTRQKEQREELLREFRELSNILGHSPAGAVGQQEQAEQEQEQEKLEKGEYLDEDMSESGGDMV